MSPLQLEPRIFEIDAATLKVTFEEESSPTRVGSFNGTEIYVCRGNTTPPNARKVSIGDEMFAMNLGDLIRMLFDTVPALTKYKKVYVCVEPVHLTFPSQKYDRIKYVHWFVVKLVDLLGEG
ncbi:MAG: hypothetical protein ACTSXJ_03730 [Candidatus Baldrarchaeia archaeon]